MTESPPDPRNQQADGQLRHLGWFLLFLAAYTSLSYWGLASSNNYYLYMFAYMWSPALAALTVCLISRRPCRTLDLTSWGSFRSLLASMVLPFVYGLLAYVVIWSIGWGTFNSEQFDVVIKKMGLTSWPVPVAGLFYLVLFGIQGTLGNMPSSLGEELGWRGFLAPLLRKRFSFAVTAILVGVLWGAWHFPLLLKNADTSSPVPIVVTLVNFTLFTVAASFLFNGISEQQRSVWPAVVLHSAHNCFLLGFFERMTRPTPSADWYTGETGSILWIAILATALLAWLACRHTEKPATHSQPQ